MLDWRFSIKAATLSLDSLNAAAVYDCVDSSTTNETSSGHKLLSFLKAPAMSDTMPGDADISILLRRDVERRR